MKILAAPAFSNAGFNPYNSLLYKNIGDATVTEYSHKRVVLQKFDVLHYHWPDGYINVKTWPKAISRMAILLLVVVWAKLRGTKIIWTVHNLFPHDAYHPKTARLFLRWFAAQCSGFIFLSGASEQAFREEYGFRPGQKSAVIPHGHYKDVYPPMPSRAKAREELDLSQDKKVFLFLGLIKPYKNVDGLIRDFIALDDADTVLVIAGSTDEDMANSLRALIGGRENIRFYPGFVSDDKLGVYYAAADAVVLPFKTILNSGSVLMALSFNRKAIAPSLGSIVELRDIVGRNWIDTYEGAFGPEVLKRAVAAPEGACPLDDFNWDRLGAQTLKFYRSVRG